MEGDKHRSDKLSALIFLAHVARQKGPGIAIMLVGGHIDPNRATNVQISSMQPKQYVLKAEPGKFEITGQPVGFVVEGPPDSSDGRRVDSRPASGGRSYSEEAGDGSFIAELSGSLDFGRSNEAHVLKTLVQALRARGDDVILGAGAADDRGEDGIVSINGQPVSVQIVSVPAEQSLWKELSSDAQACRAGSSNDAVELVRRALIHKSDKAAGTLLVLDVAHLGAIVGQALVEDYSRVYGDPECEFSLLEVWIVGPTPRSAFRLGSTAQ